MYDNIVTFEEFEAEGKKISALLDEFVKKYTGKDIFTSNFISDPIFDYLMRMKENISLDNIIALVKAEIKSAAMIAKELVRDRPGMGLLLTDTPDTNEKYFRFSLNCLTNPVVKTRDLTTWNRIDRVQDAFFTITIQLRYPFTAEPTLVRLYPEHREKLIQTYGERLIPLLDAADAYYNASGAVNDIITDLGKNS